MAATVKDTWYRIIRPGKKDKVAKVGTAELVKAQSDGSPGRPKVVKVISPGVYPEARVKASGIPDSAWTGDKPKARTPKKAEKKGADKAQKPGADKGAETEDE